MQGIIDSHAHLDYLNDLDGAIERAKSNGVMAIISMGVNQESNKHVLEISRSHSGFVCPAAGIHPWQIEEDVETDLKFISERIDDFVAIGEVGLDYQIKTSREAQSNVFKKVLDIAATSKKPLVVHSRGAWEDTFDYVSSRGLEKVVFHWYSGPRNVLKKIVDFGYLISATLAVKYSKPHREAIEYVPQENLIFETDSPVKYQGVVSEPADVLKVLDYVAELKDIGINALVKVTTKNVERFLNLKLH